MGMVQMNSNGPVSGRLVEDENAKIRDGVMGEGQGLSEEDESRINDDVEDNKKVVVQLRAPLVCWERFLPLRSLKILLVENDDSTCHVVCALLRNCGYEVIAVSNGLQAWKILEDIANHIDLILTEVVMPCLSGIGLLGKIMNHKTRKNIPVIMMSSHDSMNVVLKCLSKGAVDFLVKPIRKNELKNLWQHVWRRCHSSSGSGSGSGTRTQKSAKSAGADSDNNTASYKEDDTTRVGLNAQDRSDNGSGTQSSWTKKVVEVDSSQPVLDQVMHSRPEVLLSNNWVPVTTENGCDELYNPVKGIDLEKGAPKITALQLENLSGKVGANQEKLYEIKLDKDDEKLHKAQSELHNEKLAGDLRNRATNVIDAINNSDAQIESAVLDIMNGLCKVSDTKGKVIYKNKEMPSLELSLKRLIDVGDIGTSAHKRNVLRHSGLSAFSRYNSGSTTNQAPIGNVGSCSPLDNSSEAANTDSLKNLQSNSNNMPLNQQSNGSSNNNDIGSTTNNAFSKSAVMSEKPIVPSSAFQPPTQGKVDVVVGKTRATDQQVQVQHQHHHYHHHHFHNMPPNQKSGNHEESFQCGSSNMSSAPHVDANALNGSASESNHGSNGQNGNITSLSCRGLNVESENVVPLLGGLGFGGGTGAIQNRFAQREAALNKFRQKRKERCFEKKVRYQSRKKLAEQRPRVRGQFVRQVQENKNKDTNC
ncbi:pseudo-response regulator 7 [Hibiscus trionum]|uniref:Pseudo-response regulator 7 n=1 Tax=Hibiscus trionum TaxID=183268 RepID=A0A9W7J9X1_HIBTR|nr:pseudo-response regulator 7 [Hibiscus trionum]